MPMVTPVGRLQFLHEADWHQECHRDKLGIYSCSSSVKQPRNWTPADTAEVVILRNDYSHEELWTHRAQPQCIYIYTELERKEDHQDIKISGLARFSRRNIAEMPKSLVTHTPPYKKFNGLTWFRQVTQTGSEGQDSWIPSQSYGPIGVPW